MTKIISPQYYHAARARAEAFEQRDLRRRIQASEVALRCKVRPLIHLAVPLGFVGSHKVAAISVDGKNDLAFRQCLDELSAARMVRRSRDIILYFATPADAVAFKLKHSEGLPDLRPVPVN